MVETVKERQDKMINKESKTYIKNVGRLSFWQERVVEYEADKGKDLISEGCKTYLTKMYGWQKYKKWIAPQGNGDGPIRKGVAAEDSAIRLINYLDNTDFIKNQKIISDEFLVGIPDILDGKVVKDVKSSWNIETFLSNLGKELKPEYALQMQGYLAITGLESGEVSFCLVSTPDAIIKEQYERLRTNGTQITEEDMFNNLTFDDIPEKERRIRFIVERDEEMIEKIQKRVESCRDYMAIIEQLHFTHV